MKTLKLKLFDRWGGEMAISPDEVHVLFPYSGDRTLTKSLSRGAIRILDNTKGEIEVDLDDFEVQGLNAGERQSFVAVIHHGSKKTRVNFPGGLTVDTIGDRKSIR
jgi:hypothetical protein